MSILFEFLHLLTPAQSVDVSHDAYSRAIRAERERATRGSHHADRPPVHGDDAMRELLGGPGALAAATAVASRDGLDRYRTRIDGPIGVAIAAGVRRHVYQALVANRAMRSGPEPRRSAATAYWEDLCARAEHREPAGAPVDEDAARYDGALAQAARDGCRAALGRRHPLGDQLTAAAVVGARTAVAQWRAVLDGDDGQPLWDLHWLMARMPGHCEAPDVEHTFALLIGRDDTPPTLPLAA